MRKVRVIVTRKGMVAHSGVALILSSAEGFEVVGTEGNGILEEAFNQQPDLLVYELSTTDDCEYELLKKLRDMCAWSKIIVFTPSPIRKEIQDKFIEVSDGYIQDPILPGFLLKAIELVCYSGYFFFLGSLDDTMPKKHNVRDAQTVNIFSKRNT